MKKIRTAALFAALLVLLTSLAACSKSEIPLGMIEASDPSLTDYHLYVPKHWTVDLQTGAVSAYYSKADPSSVNVMTWEAKNTDFTPEEWWESGLADLETIYTDVTVVSSNETLLGDSRAVQYEWTAKLGENGYHFLQVATVRRGIVYVFTYGTVEDGGETSRFASHLEDVESMLREFRFS